MREQIPHWLAPTTNDPDIARRQYTLNIALLGLAGTGFLLGIISVILWALGNPTAIIGALVGFGIQPFYLLAYWLGRYRRVRLASYFPIISVFLLITGGTYQMGLGHATLIGYAMVVLTASILIGTRCALIFTLLSTMTYLVSGVLQAAGMLPGAIPPEATFVVDTVAIGLGLCALVILEWINSREINYAIEREQELNTRLQTYQQQLEEQIAQHATDLQQRSTQLDVIAQITHKATLVRDIDRLLAETAHLIADRLEFPHVGIFLSDEREEWASLRAASSQWGERLLAEGHKVRIGSEHPVGSVAKSGKPLIMTNLHSNVALDELGEESSRPNQTKGYSRTILPLQTAHRFIGMLDIQAAEPDAFSEETMAALKTIADQFALVIENIRLLQEAEERLIEIETLAGHQSRESWRRITMERPVWGYVYDGVQIVPQDKAPVTARTMEPNLTVPLQVRGTPIGRLNLVLKDRTPTPEDRMIAQAIAEQASQALESARLYQETQRRAIREQLVSEIAGQLRASLDPDTVLQTTVRELARVTGVRMATIEITGPEPEAGKDEEHVFTPPSPGNAASPAHIQDQEG